MPAAYVPLTMVSSRTARVLARCNGFRVTAGDHVVGSIATPVFAGDSLRPDYLLVRVDAAIPGIFRAVPLDLVAAADDALETVELAIDAAELASLPAPVMEPNIGGSGHGRTPVDVDERNLVRHRIATPLTIIRGSAVTLRDVPNLPNDQVRRLADAIERATEDLEHAMLAPGSVRE